MRRRELLVALAGLVGGCSRRAAPSRDERPRAEPSATRTASLDWQTLSFAPNDEMPDGEEVLLYAPSESKSWPTLIALHGRGEAGRGLAAGSHGWRDDYDLEAMHKRLRAPPLTSDDVGGFLDAERLGALNASLEKRAYEGLSVACPYTPIVRDPSPEGAQSFAKFVTDALLPRIASLTGHPSARTTTGIDGVSMGGRLALLVGLTHPEVFGSVGALQPAIRPEEAELFSSLAKRALAKGPLSLRLVSSEDDPFLRAVRALSKQLDADQVPHALVVTRGPHDYVWNRGPGAAEMLAFHERVLRGLPAP